MGSQVAQWERIHLQCRRCRLDPWVWKICWRENWQSTPVFSPGKSHGQRSLVGCSPWGYKGSDTAWQLSTPCASWENVLKNYSSSRGGRMMWAYLNNISVKTSIWLRKLLAVCGSGDQSVFLCGFFCLDIQRFSPLTHLPPPSVWRPCHCFWKVLANAEAPPIPTGNSATSQDP